MEILDITKANAEIGTLQASLKTSQDELATVKASVAAFEIQTKALNQSLETLAATHKSEIAKLNSEFDTKLTAEKASTEKAKQSAVDESIKLVASQGINVELAAESKPAVSGETLFNEYKSMRKGSDEAKAFYRKHYSQFEEIRKGGKSVVKK